MFSPLTFMMDSTMNLMSGSYYKCEIMEHYFTILREYLRIFRVKEKFKAMWYGIVTNSHIAFNCIHIKFWGVCDGMVLGMESNLLMTSYSWLRNSQEVGPNYLWCLRITSVCFILFYFSQMHGSGRSIISIKMIISSDIDKQLRYYDHRF